MNAERSPRNRHLQEASQIDPQSSQHAEHEPDTHDRGNGEERSPEPPSDDPPEPFEVKPRLTSSQLYRVHLAESNARESRSVAFVDMSPADQVMQFARLRRDNEELLKIIRDTTQGA